MHIKLTKQNLQVRSNLAPMINSIWGGGEISRIESTLVDWLVG